MLSFNGSSKVGVTKIWLTLAFGLATAVLLGLITGWSYGAAEQAKSAGSFVDSIGVNTHLHYWDTVYKDYPLITDKLSTLGVKHARDGAHLTSDQIYNDFVYGRYKDLNVSLGVKFNLIVDPRAEKLDSIDSEKVRRITEMAGNSLQTFEGPNEYDLSGKTDWASALRDY
jgi:hypothetical protein